MEDMISRNDAYNTLTEYYHHTTEIQHKALREALERVPEAEPEQTNSWCINSWCNNCKEYYKEKHSCPRFNRVIKQTLDEIYSHAEIVRCKDCNHWSRESICDGFCSEDCMRHDEDFYCGYAERRTDG